MRVSFRRAGRTRDCPCEKGAQWLSHKSLAGQGESAWPCPDSISGFLLCDQWAGGKERPLSLPLESRAPAGHVGGEQVQLVPWSLLVNASAVTSRPVSVVALGHSLVARQHFKPVQTWGNPATMALKKTAFQQMHGRQSSSSQHPHGTRGGTCWSCSHACASGPGRGGGRWELTPVHP